MKTEEFYKKIQEKIGETEMEFEKEFPFGKSSFQESPFGESQFLEWNKQDVWQRIEQKQTKRKKPFVWWQAVAASVVLLGGLGIYFSNQKTNITTTNQAINNTNPTISIQSTVNPTTKSTQLLADNDNRKNNVVKAMATINKPTTEQVITPISDEKYLVEKEPAVAINETQNSISKNESEVNTNQQTPANDNYRFVPYQGFVEKRVVPQRRERVAILEIPDDEEDFNQTPQKEKKNGLVARLGRKLGKKGVEPAEELPSINNKPNKVWAFVKESFKNETMTSDSTNR